MMQTNTPDMVVARRGTLLRARYQIPIGILFAIVLPMAVRAVATGISPALPTQYITAIGGMIALVLGYLSYRRIQVFPGINSGGYIATAFTITFMALAVVLFMLRLDYSRLQFLSSYLLTIAFFTFIHLKFVVHRSILLGVVPNGATQALPRIDRVIWLNLESPLAAPLALNGVVVDLGADHCDEWKTRIADFALQGTPVYHVKEAIEQLTGRVEIAHLSENTLGSLNPNAMYIKMKAVADAILAMVLLIVLSLPMLVVALLIRLDSSGPALFRQQRTGFRARPFTVYKFRSMLVSTETAAIDARLSAVTQDKDPRITRIGALLRRTRLDELPQLINVLKGEMSLIGPRPEAVALTRWYEAEIPFYHYRHIIKPGLTGWAQVNQGHVADVTDVQEKLNLDFYYIKNFSMWLDMLIALRTVQIILTGHGAR